jgi:hypothetical protein
VQVALEPAALAVRSLDHARPGPAQLVEAGPELRLEPGVLQRDGGRRGDLGEQVALLAQRRVVEERGDAAAVAALE